VTQHTSSMPKWLCHDGCGLQRLILGKANVGDAVLAPGICTNMPHTVRQSPCGDAPAGAQVGFKYDYRTQACLAVCLPCCVSACLPAPALPACCSTSCLPACQSAFAACPCLLSRGTPSPNRPQKNSGQLHCGVCVLAPHSCTTRTLPYDRPQGCVIAALWLHTNTHTHTERERDPRDSKKTKPRNQEGVLHGCTPSAQETMKQEDNCTALQLVQPVPQHTAACTAVYCRCCGTLLGDAVQHSSRYYMNTCGLVGWCPAHTHSRSWVGT
jgi:hypothetical protein